MKVLMINGSPRVGGNTELALREMIGELEKQGIEVDYVQVGAMDVRGCIACGR